MAVTTTNYDVHPFPLTETEKELPPSPDVAVTPCDPWPRPYYLEGGLRRVAPYHYTYNTFCKQRWRGRELLDIFATEFRDRTEEYYRDAIDRGLIVLNGKPVESVHTKVQNGDVISHTLHRHEPPVTAQPIRVIHEDEDQIVIDKPAGVPVHPAGRYRYNSVVEIMRAERSYSFNPLPCNRLDRLTSGVMFIGKTPQKAEAISQKLRERTVRKEYVARVKGRFPDGEGWGGDSMRGGVVRCDEPILQISPILGLNRARASGKNAKTLFRRIAYYPEDGTSRTNSVPENTMDAETGRPTALPAGPVSGTEADGYSIVHCLPLTGRTHQLRVHLQFLGHPISNDPIYSNRRVFGPGLAKNNSSGDDDAQVIAALSKMGKTELADAHAYEERPKLKRDAAEAQGPPVAPAITDVSQTQQITLSDLNSLEAKSKLRPSPTVQSVDASTSTPSPQEPPSVSSFTKFSQANPKPLPQSLHCGHLPLPNGPLPHSTPSDLPQDADPNDPTYQAYLAAHTEAVEDYNRRKGEKLTGELCAVCDTPLYSDPGAHELGIYLHALSYADLEGEWRYQSAMPRWGLPPAGVHGPQTVGEWEYEGAGKEGLEIGDEKEDGRIKNKEGMLKNRELKDGTCAGRP